MREVRELEGLIVTEIRDLRGLESKLDRRFASLEAGSPRTRAFFLKGLMDLDKRARGIEDLIDALSQVDALSQGALTKGDALSNGVSRTALASAFM